MGFEKVYSSNINEFIAPVSRKGRKNKILFRRIATPACIEMEMNVGDGQSVYVYIGEYKLSCGERKTLMYAKAFRDGAKYYAMYEDEIWAEKLRACASNMYGVICRGKDEDFSDVAAVAMRDYMALACEIDTDGFGEGDDFVEYLMEKLNLLSKKVSEIWDEIEVLNLNGKSGNGRKLVEELGRNLRTARLANIIYKILIGGFIC